MLNLLTVFTSVQSLSHVQLFVTPRTVARQASLSITNSRSLLRLMSIVSQWCHPTISSSYCVDHNKLWKILKEMGIPDHLNCLLRYLYAGQEATVRIGHGTMDWFITGKGVHQNCVLSPCLFNLHAENNMQSAGLAEAWAGIKININNLRYAYDITLMQKEKRNWRASW